MEKSFDYEIYLTSIYTFISRDSKFTKFLKEMVSQNELVADPTTDRLEELAKIIDNALNAIIKLSESVSEQFNKFENRFDIIDKRISQLDPYKKGVSDHVPKIESEKTIDLLQPSKPLASLIPPKLKDLSPPPEPVLSSTTQNTAQLTPGQTLRSSIIDELKDLFSRVKKQDY